MSAEEAFMSKVKIAAIAIVVAVLSAVGFGFMQAGIANAETRECSDNSIIRCGAMSASELKSEYAKNERGLKAIYSHYNIDASDIAASGSAKTGSVHPNGTVTVGGKVVATNAYTVGRSGSLGGNKVKINDNISVYEGAGRLKSSLSAFVFFDKDGNFKSAILKVCGNPVRATPPKPTPKPIYSCDNLTAKAISRNEYRFTTDAAAKNGAKITKYTYNFGDGTVKSGEKTISHAYSKAGNYTATVKVSVLVDGKTVTAPGDCKVTVTVKKENCPIPGKEQYPKDSPECKEDKPAIDITKTVNDVEHVKVAVNEEFTYQITVRNTGDVTLKNAVVTDTAPSQVTLISASLGEVSGNKWTYTIPELKVGESKSFTITAKYGTYVAGTHVNNVCVDTPTVPGSPDDCDKASTETYKEETPPTPEKLPETGVGDTIATFLGAGGLVTAGAAYVASRRSIR